MKYLLQLEPRQLYHFFEEISAIPRVSKNEAAIADYLVAFAKERGLACYRDSMHNVLIRKDGQLGGQGLPPVLLEGHTDMCGVKIPASTHNFDTDPIELVVKGNILRANGTTLGADNGCAVAIMMLLLDRKDLPHPPLECLFTAQEELGMVGAKHFDLSQIKARRAIGLDAGEEGVLRIGTTTKYRTTYVRPVRREPARGTCHRLLVHGLRGGAQGASIPKDRACAIKLTGRLYHTLCQAMDVRLISIAKNGKGIAEDCESLLMLPNKDNARLLELLAQQQERLRLEYALSDPGISLTLEDAGAGMDMMDEESTRQIARALYLMPYGGRYRNQGNPLEQFACSILTRCIDTREDEVSLVTTLSAEDGYKANALNEETATLLCLHGFAQADSQVDRGWDADAASPIRDAMVAAYEGLYGKRPAVCISHGSNDCVILKQRIPDLDVVTTAATYVDYHTPGEHLYLDTLARVYHLVAATLGSLC